ncbi:MAG: fused MFS/spermidine synthase [Candidatus Eisenbacteria bacterium]|uniref:Fused MFS/spermidine synthase n=1 Tax=Eiseniibacteriota bacterium TaxID=2212470 RepID=A0A956NBY2_UNCEI|nr:fused MFS/spermidine synthase [Candidatus Eisenbacteria bacterium]
MSESVSRSVRTVVLLVFLASGAAALIYQVAWTRLLTLVFGSTIFAVSSVLSSFMAGLGLGSWVLSRIADRPIRSLRLYGWLEIGVGLYALLFPAILAAVRSIYTTAAQDLGFGFGPNTALKFALAVLILIVPTFLMGGTLPVLSRYLTRNMRLATREIAFLYGLNTAGAVVGTVLAGFFLLPEFGIRVALFVAVALNIGVGILAWFVGGNEVVRAEDRSDDTATEDHGTSLGEATTETQVRLTYFALFAQGLLALGYEVIWTRILMLYMGTTNYSFSTMLMTFLFGIAVGSAIVGTFASRIRRPYAILAWLQTGMGLSLFVTVPMLHRASSWFLGPEPGQLGWTEYNLTKAGLSFLVMLLPTLLMGASFPVAAQVVMRSFARVGRTIGALYSFNTLGAILGASITGFLLIPKLGPSTAFVVLSVGNLLVGLILFVTAKSRIVRGTALVPIAAAIALVFMHGWVNDTISSSITQKIQRLGKVLVEVDGLESNVAISENTYGFRQLWVNGDVVARSVGSVSGHNMLGHLPMLFARSTDKVVVIALGTGISAGATSLYDPKVLDVVEISPTVRANVHYFAHDNFGLDQNPAVRFVIDDGRNYVQVTDLKYDVVAAEPLHPQKTGVANLYTKEYYQACRRILEPGGVVVQWIPLHELSKGDVKDLTRTFVEEFPVTTGWLFGLDLVLLGHESEFQVDLPELERRLDLPNIREDLSKVNITNSTDLLNHLVFGPEGAKAYCEGARIMSDWYPFIEYDGPKHVHEGSTVDDILQDLITHRTGPVALIGTWTEPADSLRRVYQIQEAAWPTAINGLIAQSRGRLEESVQLLESALINAPWMGDARYYLSRSYYQLGERIASRRRVEDAAAVYGFWSRGLPYDPDSPSLLFGVAAAAEQLGKKDEARETWQRLADTLPEYADRRTLALQRVAALTQ